MGQVLPFLEGPPPHSSPEPGSHSRPPQSIKASPRPALLVESNEELQRHYKDWLVRGGYTVRTAGTAEEGFRLFQDCGPFNLVLINYAVPEGQEDKIDHLAAFQIHAVQLAMAIRVDNPTQEIVIMAPDYRSATEVPLPPEVSHVRLLAGNDQLHRLLERVEIDRAIQSLTPADWLRLNNYANYKVRGLGPAATDRDGQDLLGQAVYKTLLGDRRWNRSVDFVQHLRGAMRSIADRWKRQLRSKPFEDPTVIDREGEEYSLIDTMISEHASFEQRAIEESELLLIFELFKDDPEATCILHGAADGLKRSDIMLRYRLADKQYAAALRRIRQTLRARGKKDK